ncbi:ABC transporter permease [Ruoffia sp. FAM 26254]|uniref:ABC transporter permease n=1 Tax=Ruoffia sp. FAM 26254 TaxID=3259518 RepID=UPI0038855BDE
MEHIQQNSSLTKGWSLIYQQMQRQWTYKIALWVLGLPLHIIFFVIQLIHFTKYKSQPVAERISDDEKTVLKQKLIKEEQNKQAYFKQSISAEQTEKRVNQRLNHYVQSLVIENNDMSERIHLSDIFADWIVTPIGFITSIILAWPMYILMIVYRMPILRYIVERLFLMVFVIFGVTWIVFTLLHFSPSDPAQNILGVQATPEQIQNFNVLHGLDDSYWVQLFRTLKGIVTFDLGYTYVGNELVIDALLRRFPITLQVTFFSLAISLVIAIPAGIYSAVKVNSLFDQFFMFIALIGLSIPTFWLGLIFILNFSIRNRWLPATFNPDNPWSLLMPAIVLGTSLAASVARMTRASTLEVIHEDYLLTARSKGMSNWRIIWRHIIPNALIPVITVIGLQFGGMLGGSAVTEQVFNINGVGSYIVEKQFVPDIPAVLGGVIYIAIIVSLVNLVVDLLYALIDPRIRTTLKN